MLTYKKGTKLTIIVHIGQKRKEMLTHKQEKFVEELVKGKSQREAYQSAYNTAKMKPATIDSRAYELFKNGEITARYNELMEKSVEKTEWEATEVRKEIIIQLMSILKADISDYYSFTRAKRGASKARLKDLTNLDTRAVQSITTDRLGNNHIKLYDKTAAIRELKEIFGLVEQVSDSGETITINVPKELLS